MVTVAARESVDRRFVPVTERHRHDDYFRIKGSDLAALRNRKLAREEARKRWRSNITDAARIGDQSRIPSPNPGLVSNILMLSTAKPALVLLTVFLLVPAAPVRDSQSLSLSRRGREDGLVRAGVETARTTRADSHVTLKNVSTEPVANVQLNAVIAAWVKPRRGRRVPEVIGVEGVPRRDDETYRASIDPRIHWHRARA